MSFLILALAAFAMVAYVVSAVLGLGLWTMRRPISALAPAGQARLFFASALVPFFTASAVIVAALAPFFGWIRGHNDLSQIHSHPHLCPDHSISSWPTLTLVVLASFLSLRFIRTLVGQVRALYKAARTQRKLIDASELCSNTGQRILPMSESQAFVLGLFRPTLYLSRGLVDGSEKAHLDAVVAHEQAHIQRNDPLRRFIAGFGLCFHLPLLSAWLDDKHARAQEMAADDIAGEIVGSRKAIASALVALAKAQLRSPPPTTAMAFSGSDVQERVMLLLDNPKHRDWPSVSSLAAIASALLLGVALTADAVHHQVEYFLGILGS